jgi:hypothetical protein
LIWAQRLEVAIAVNRRKRAENDFRVKPVKSVRTKFFKNLDAATVNALFSKWVENVFSVGQKNLFGKPAYCKGRQKPGLSLLKIYHNTSLKSAFLARFRLVSVAH